MTTAARKAMTTETGFFREDLSAMNLTEEQKQLRERMVIALVEATLPFQEEAADPEVTLELLIQAADLLKRHLQRELEERREESD
jgi:hypothetical protein